MSMTLVSGGQWCHIVMYLTHLVLLLSDGHNYIIRALHLNTMPLFVLTSFALQWCSFLIHQHLQAEKNYIMSSNEA